MLKRLLLLWTLMIPMTVLAQLTTVSGGPIVAPNGAIWASTSVQAQFVPNNCPAPWTTNTGAPVATYVPTTTNTSGSFSSLVLNDNNTGVSCPGSQWNFVICTTQGIPPVTACFATGPITITGSTQSITTQLNTAAVNIPSSSASSSFSTISNGNNTTAVMTVGTGASLGPSGSGTVTSTLHELVATASTGGTTQYLLVVYDGVTGNVTTAPTASAGIIGFASATATSGNPLYIIDSGAYTCIADNTITTGDLLGVGTTTAGRCKDLGTAQGNGVPSNIQIVGKALSGGSAGAQIAVQTVGAGHYGTLVVAASVNTSVCSVNGCTMPGISVTGGAVVDTLAASTAVSVGATPPTACGSATGCVGMGQGAVAGTPAANQNYMRATSTGFTISVGASAEWNLPLSSLAALQSALSIPAAQVAANLASSTSTGVTGILPVANGGTGSAVANTTFTVASSTTINANTCSPAAASAATQVAMTGVTTGMTFSVVATTDTANVTGWGAPAAGVLYITTYPTAGYFNYHVCNNTASSITTGGSVTFNVSAR